jgi:uncharacterized protein (DUF433 family)
MYDRIVRQPLVQGGLACLRDTGITVHEVVQLALAGHDPAEILMKYPQLDTQDIHQALAYAINDMLQALVFWKHEGVKYLSTSRGYSEMLAGQADFISVDEISEQERTEWIMQIFNYSRIAIGKWQQLKDTSFRKYSREMLDPKPNSPQDLADDVQACLDEENPNLAVSITCEAGLPHVLVDGYMVRALVNLMSDAGTTFDSDSELRIFAFGSGVGFRVRRRILYQFSLDKLFAPNTGFATADAIIYQHNSALQVDVEDESGEVTLIFALEGHTESST